MMTRHRLAATVLLSITLGSLAGGRALAQGPARPGDAQKQKIYTNKLHFILPVSIDEKERPKLQAVKLFAKIGNGDWKFISGASAGQKSFTYDAPEDGEYWFSVVTVDRLGQMTPADVRQEPPMLMVVVDTQPPVVEVRPVTGPNGESWLRCAVKDANPDYSSLKLTYRGADQLWHPLEQIAGVRGVFRAPGPEVSGGMVKVTVEDLAHNLTTQEVSLKQPPASDVVQTSHSTTIAVPPAKAPESPSKAADPLPKGPDPLPKGPDPLPLAPTLPIAPPPPPGPAAGKTAAAESTSARAKLPEKVEKTSLPASPGQPARQLLNTTRAAVDYHLDQVGPSGISKVEVYITSDEGKTWLRLCEDPDRRSPAEIELPGEGLFGIRLVVTNGNGFGGSPPARGEAPTCWIEVDLTSPKAQLRDIDPVAKDGALELRWTASDKNLGPEPIALFYAAKQDGPWTAIAKGLKNDGLYRWTFPREVGSQFFVRMEVTDQAGNMTRCGPSTPVVLDMTEPRASVVGVTGVSVRPLAGN
jgi:hypothetical protein